ncbi:MAG TPA: iron dicitrate transport regulator FecR, partial [Roseateles sp.]|nr:iron dicitrate transport regulator FecR [Roseateles sp.]
LFEVAKDAGRPFVVSVADADVVATGTAFLVRASSQAAPGEDAFGVTLLEGQVIVRPTGDVVQSALNSPVVMTPGERLRVGQATGERGHTATTGARVDRPQIDALLAWKRGFVVLDDVALAAAVADMNRYSRVQIVLDDAEALAAMRVSGAFRVGDNEVFARAVATLHGLVVRPRDGGLELAKK